MKTANEWQVMFPTSAELFDRATSVLPGGISHDSRQTEPFPLFMARSNGSRKWDVDGNEYVDYWMGHGALILGHGYPPVIKAIQEQAVLGTHYGASHELEVQWAELIQSMVPCAEIVRFCGTGTEANLLALRLARAATGRDKIVRFHDHFHGWHDYVTMSMSPPYGEASSPGVPDEIGKSIVALPDDDVEIVAETLRSHEVAAVIVEPTGASFGTIPISAQFLQDLRTITTEHGTLLIFDEVVSGFRLAPGGAQELFGVRPDMCTLAKAVAGGLPAAAVAGRSDVLSLLGPKGYNGVKVPHRGTFNGNPLAAAAGVVALEELRTGRPQTTAAEIGTRLKQGINQVLLDAGLEGAAYGIGSLFHVHFGRGMSINDDGSVADFDRDVLAKDVKANDVNLYFRRGLLEQGVDVLRAGGMISAAHNDEDLDITFEAIRQVAKQMKAAGL